MPVTVPLTDRDVWVANFDDGTVSRVNIKTNRVVGEPAKVGAGPIAIASGRSGVWVVSYAAGTIQRIDPTTGQAPTAFRVGRGREGSARDETCMGVTDALDGSGGEYYPMRSNGTWRLTPGASVLVAGGPQGIALTPTYVWVASRLSQTVTRINRATLQTVSYAVGDGPHSVVVTGGAVWVSNEYDGTLTWIDQSSNEVHQLPSIGASPRDLAVDPEGRIWVALGAFADPAHRGGTLRVVGTSIPGGQGGIDPVSVTDASTTRVQRFVYDGLVALGMFGGPDIVTDLAQGPQPLPSDENRTYVFTLRPGIRYSTGAVVRASDFRTALRKALTVGERREQFANVVGGRNCIDHPAACDLSAGLITDDATRRVTFKLETPDPNFLDTLSRSLYPVPPGTPTTVSGVPVPGTGPYRISAYVPGKKFTLERNHYFSQGSYAAQPAGYPAVIDFRMVADDRASAQEVIAGRADVAWVGPGSPSLIAELKRLYPDGNPAAPQFKEHVLAQLSVLVSARVAENYDSNAEVGPLLSQLRVR